MRYKIGDFVKTLIQKGEVKEGDVGVIDAIHLDSYTVGFYATEDALLYSGPCYEEELAPYEKKEEISELVEGDVVELTEELPSLPALSVGEIVSKIDDGVYACSFAIPSMSIPLLVPVKASCLRKIGHHEKEEHHHH